jgi:predicted ATPase
MKTVDCGVDRALELESAAPTAQRAIFAPAGEYWTIAYGGATCTLKNSLGLSYLQRLLEHPGEEFHALDLLMGPGTGSAPGVEGAELSGPDELTRARPGDLGAMLDPRAKREFRVTLSQLGEELEELRARGAHARAEKVAGEIEAIKRELMRAVGLGGRDRRAGSAAERARINVTRALRSAIQRIAEHHAALGKLLDESVRTGSFCRYLPRARLDWKFASSEPESVAASVAALPAAVAAPLRSSASAFSSAPSEPSAFVNRTAERAHVGGLLRRVANGRGSIVSISGPAGIGKTRLARELGSDARGLGFTTLAGNCYDRDSVPFVAIVEAFESALAQAATPASFRAELGDEAAEIARLMPELRRLFPDIPPPLQGSPEQTRRALFNTIVVVIARRSRLSPLLLLFEDVHWADEGTLALLAHLARSVTNLPVMVMVTYRDDAIDPASQFGESLNDLLRCGLEHVALRGLEQAAVAQLVNDVSGGKLPASLVDLIYANTEGNSLFVLELVRHVIAKQGPSGPPEGTDQTELNLPQSLRLLIGRRLTQVSKPTQKVLGTAAVIGRSFTFALLEAATGIEAEQLLELVEEAERAGLISSRLRYPDAQFKFAHELIRRAVLDDLSVARRQRLHLSVAGAIEQLYPNALEDQAEDLAHHLWNAGGAAPAGKTIRHLQVAGTKAVQAAANVEAINHFRKALRLVNNASDSAERTQTELMLQVALAVPLAAIKGYGSPELEAVFARARLLCRQAEDTPQLFPVLWLRWLFHTARGEHITAVDLARQCLRLAEKANQPALLLAAHHALGVSLSALADFEPALEHLEQTIKLYDPAQHATLAFQFGQDFGVVARSHGAIDLWYLGYPERALKMSDDALEQARRLAHSFSLAAALVQRAWLHWLARDVRATRERAEEALRLAGEGDFGYWRPIATVLRGWALAQGHEVSEGITQMHEGVAAYRATGSGVLRPAFLGALAEACARGGKPQEGLDALREACAVSADSGERWWEPELYRLEGELVLGLAGTAPPAAAVRSQAEACFQRAIEIAHEQKAKLLELRALVSLSRLGAPASQYAIAGRSLRDLYGWFTEGFDSADLIGAARLLQSPD